MAKGQSPDCAMQGLSTELGAFVAGVMMSATEQQEGTLHQLEPLKQFFLSACSSALRGSSCPPSSSHSTCASLLAALLSPSCPKLSW